MPTPASPRFFAWRGDHTFKRLIDQTQAGARGVHALETPLRVVHASGEVLILFDYAFFLFLKDVLFSLLRGESAEGAVRALFEYAAAARLEEARPLAAAALLLSACRRRAPRAMAPTRLIAEELHYEIAVILALAHEQAHREFEADGERRRLWLQEARDWLAYVSTTAASAYPDPALADALQRECAAMAGHARSLEELACDLFALDRSIRRAVEARPSAAAAYVDAHYAALRALLLALYVARMTALAAGFAAQAVAIASDDELSAPDGRLREELRPRMQVALFKLISLKQELGLVPRRRSAPLSELIDTREAEFQTLAASMTAALTALRGGGGVLHHVWIEQALPKNAAPFVDLEALATLYLRPDWRSPS